MSIFSESINGPNITFTSDIPSEAIVKFPNGKSYVIDSKLAKHPLTFSKYPNSTSWKGYFIAPHIRQKGTYTYKLFYNIDGKNFTKEYKVDYTTNTDDGKITNFLHIDVN